MGSDAELIHFKLGRPPRILRVIPLSRAFGGDAALQHKITPSNASVFRGVDGSIVRQQL
jgi:hypothetical protein